MSCGIEVLTISVPYIMDNTNPISFGTTIGEEFYARCDKFDEILTTFQSFSFVKEAGM